MAHLQGHHACIAGLAAIETKIAFSTEAIATNFNRNLWHEMRPHCLIPIITVIHIAFQTCIFPAVACTSNSIFYTAKSQPSDKNVRSSKFRPAIKSVVLALAESRQCCLRKVHAGHQLQHLRGLRGALRHVNVMTDMPPVSATSTQESLCFLNFRGSKC